MPARRIAILLISFLILSTLGTIALFWGTGFPLGVPEEWTWKRIAVPDDSRLDAVLGWTSCAVAGGAYCLAAWLGARRMESAPRGETFLWLIGLAVAGFVWLWFVQESPAPVENRLAKAPFVTYYRGPDGYFDEARYQMKDVRSYLAGYEQRMTEGDVLHFGTHPPGMALLHRFFINRCEQSPVLTRFLNRSQPASVVEAFDTISRSEGKTKSAGASLTDHDRAAIWLAILFMQAIGVATVVPLFFLAHRIVSREAAWMAVCFWPLIPSLAVFLPKSDALFPFLGCTFLSLWLTGFDRRSPLLCIASGFVMWLGMFLSLALLPVALLGMLLTMVEIRREHRADPAAEAISTRVGSKAKLAGWSLLGFGLPILLVWLATDANLMRIWIWNYSNHAGFYDKYTRTYLSWLWVNPLELLFGVGPPVMVLAIASCTKLRLNQYRDRTLLYVAACFGVWAILWLSGKNMGEAARLWLVVMPWPIWIAAVSLNQTPTSIDGNRSVPDSRRAKDNQQPAGASPTAVWLVALVCQAITCTATVSRVNGFDFGL